MWIRLVRVHFTLPKESPRYPIISGSEGTDHSTLWHRMIPHRDPNGIVRHYVSIGRSDTGETARREHGDPFSWMCTSLCSGNGAAVSAGGNSPDYPRTRDLHAKGGPPSGLLIGHSPPIMRQGTCGRPSHVCTECQTQPYRDFQSSAHF